MDEKLKEEISKLIKEETGQYGIYVRGDLAKSYSPHKPHKEVI